MASVGATDQEIADFVGCDPQTIRNRFSAILVKSCAGMKLRLRQAQYKAALAGDRAMLIWLGKQMLGQAEPPIRLQHQRGIEEVLDELDAGAAASVTLGAIP